MAKDQQVLTHNMLSLEEHVTLIQGHQQRIKEAIFDFVAAISNAFDQLGGDVFDRELAKELGMSASTLNRWKSIGSSRVIAENADAVPPVFSSLYEITLLEKMYVDEKGETQGLKEVQKLINRGSISSATETKDIRFFVDRLKKDRLDRKRQTKEQMLLEHGDSVGYGASQQYSNLSQAVEAGLKVRTIVMAPPTELLTRWGDPAFLKSDIQAEFPVSELRGKSEAEFITCLIQVPNVRIDVGIKLLNASGFNYRRTFFHISNTTKGDVILLGQRGMGGAITEIQETDLASVAEHIGSGPFMMLFDRCNRDGWMSIEDPVT